MNADADDLHKEDWYAILNCSYTSTKEQIEKSARKLFLKYHPDKTSDAAAPAKFLQVQKAKEILLDESKRKIIDEHRDKVLKRKQYESKRNDTMDRERKRMREELSARMSAATKKSESMNEEEKAKAEALHQKKKLSELRERNKARAEQSAEESQQRANRMEQEYRNIQKQVFEGSSKSLGHVRVKWRKEISHNVDTLMRDFEVFGSIEEIEMSQSKSASATIIFSQHSSAIAAVDGFLMSKDYRVSLLTQDRGGMSSAAYSSSWFNERPSSATSAPSVSTNSNPAYTPSTADSVPPPQPAAIPKATKEAVLSKEAEILQKLMQKKKKKDIATSPSRSVSTSELEKLNEESEIFGDNSLNRDAEIFVV